MTQSSTVAYKCPNCGAGLAYDPEKQTFKCDFCFSSFVEKDLSGTDAQEEAQREQTEAEAFCEHMNVYNCPNCGAEVVADDTTAADFCYYCHNPVVLSGRLSGQMRPHAIIPFTIDKKGAEEKFLAWCRKKWFVPKAFKSQEHAAKIQGVYYPFWVTDADTDASMEAKAFRRRTWIVGNTQFTETKEYRVRRAGDIHFEDIVTCALTGDDDLPGDLTVSDKQMLEGVLPYPSEALQPFSMPYLSGFVAKKRDIEREELSAEVRERMDDYARTLLRRTVEGYSTVDVDEMNVNVTSSRWEYALLPVWILTYHDKKGKVYTFALNGHTGKVFGQWPIHYPKLALLAAAIAIPATAILTAIGGVLF